VYSIVTGANAQQLRRPIATDRAFALHAMMSPMTVSMFFCKDAAHSTVRMVVEAEWEDGQDCFCRE
jgi:hypothetical protein